MVYVCDGKYELPEDLAYSKQYLYVNREKGTIGMSEIGYAILSSAKEIKFLDAEQVAKDDPFAKLITAQGPVTLRAPIGGKILKVNPATLAELKKDPYNEGFFIQMEPQNLEDDLKDLVTGDKIKAWGEEQLDFLSAGEYTFKVIEVGESSVGKTAIKVRFTDNYFKRDLKSTLGIDFGSKQLDVEYLPEDIMMGGTKKLKIKVTVWDFGGQQIYAGQRKQYYDHAKGALLVYDVTNPSSFKALPTWIKEMEQHSGKYPVLLIANKIDLESERKIPRKDGEEFAKKNGYMYFESSAKDGRGVQEAFEALAIEIYKKTLKT